MERREVAKADPKSSFISEAAVRFRRIKEAALELLQQPGFEYTYENLRSFCSFKHIPFDPSHTKTNFRDAIAGLKQEGFADTFLEQRASVILSAIKAETEAKRARNESRTLQYKRSRMERQTRFQNEGTVGKITIYNGENIYNSKNCSFSGSAQEGSGMANSKSGGQPAAEGVRSRASKEARSRPPKAGRAASASSTAATCAKEEEEPEMESPPAKRTRSEDHPSCNENASNPAKPPYPHHNTQNKRDSSQSNHRPVLGELKGNILVEEGSALPPEHKGLDISRRQLAPGDINVTLAAAEAALDAAVEECDEAEQAYNKVLRTGSSTKALEDAFRHRKRARAEKQRLLDDMQALGKVHFDLEPATCYNGLERPSHVATEPVHGRPPVPLSRASPVLPTTASGALRRPSDLPLKTPLSDEPAKPPKHSFPPAAAFAPNTKAEPQALSENEQPKSKQRPSQLSSKGADGHRSLADRDRAGAERRGKGSEDSADLGRQRGQPQPVAVDDKVETRPSDEEDDVEGGDRPGLERHESQPVDKMDEEMEEGEIAEEGGEMDDKMELMAGMEEGEVVVEAAPIGDMNGPDMSVDGSPQQPGVVFNSSSPASDTPQLALEGASLALANIETVDKQQIDSPALEKTAELHALEEQQEMTPDSLVKTTHGSAPLDIPAAAEPAKDGSMGGPGVSLVASISIEKALGLGPLMSADAKDDANLGDMMAEQDKADSSAAYGMMMTVAKNAAACGTASSLEKTTDVMEHFSMMPMHGLLQEQQEIKLNSLVKTTNGSAPLHIPAAAEPVKDGSMGGPGVPLVASISNGKALGLAPLTAADPQDGANQVLMGGMSAKEDKVDASAMYGTNQTTMDVIASRTASSLKTTTDVNQQLSLAPMHTFPQGDAIIDESMGLKHHGGSILDTNDKRGIDESHRVYEAGSQSGHGSPGKSIIPDCPKTDAERAEAQRRWEEIFDLYISPPTPPHKRALRESNKQAIGSTGGAASAAAMPWDSSTLGFTSDDPLFHCDDISLYADDDDDLVPALPAQSQNAPLVDTDSQTTKCQPHPPPSRASTGCHVSSSTIGRTTAATVDVRTKQNQYPTPASLTAETKTGGGGLARVGLAELLPTADKETKVRMSVQNEGEGFGFWKKYENPHFEWEDGDDF